MAGLGLEQGGAMSSDQKKAALRKRLFATFGAVLAVGAVGVGGYWFAVSSHYVSTDNAYVNVSTAQVTPQTGGTVLSVFVENTNAVKRGDVLVTIDPADAQLAYNQADAAYRLTVRKVQTYFATLAARQADFERTRLDYERRQGLVKSGAVSNEEMTAIRNNFEAARAALDAAKAMTANTDVANHPEVLAAKAALDTAKLNLDRTVVRAPVNGVVSQRSVQVGQRIAAGTPVMTVVPVDDVYVDANFKEDQLAKVRAGQSVELTSDMYGSSVTFHGRVVGLSGGTGAAFALIPAQNATGNWIKVVQRVPVRIQIEKSELKAHPLRVGLSMTATVDVDK